jgi:H+/Cl- antiporter ClcA
MAFLKDKIKPLVAALGAGILAGSAAAIFLYALDWATVTREQHSWLVLVLPITGFGIAWFYERYGSDVERGNNLLLEEIHEPKQTVPLKMAPMILLSTVITHLVGGSAGREGTAVQMGGSIADQIAARFKLERKAMLMMGMSGGFGAVFGVPWAGAVFGLEVLTSGKLEFALALECLVASFAGHFTCLLWGIHHTDYPLPDIVPFSLTAVLWLALAGMLFGFCARAFVILTHVFQFLLRKITRSVPLRAFVGGMVILFIYYLLGTSRFEGLGIPVIVNSLRIPLPQFDFAWKTFFTTLTLASGFKGGEVTPLLFIGSTLGNSLSSWIPLPLSLLAACGFVAVFAGAANTPFACAVMAMEIFGWKIGFFALVACWVSFYFSSISGIYHAQKPGGHKLQSLPAKLKSSFQRFF